MRFVGGRELGYAGFVGRELAGQLVVGKIATDVLRHTSWDMEVAFQRRGEGAGKEGP